MRQVTRFDGPDADVKESILYLGGWHRAGNSRTSIWLLAAPLRLSGSMRRRLTTFDRERQGIFLILMSIAFHAIEDISQHVEAIGSFI
jgi:hypothetical protein